MKTTNQQYAEEKKRHPTTKPPGFHATDPRAIAYRLGVSVPTIYKAINDGRLKARKLGTRTIILPDHEQEYIDSLKIING